MALALQKEFTLLLFIVVLSRNKAGIVYLGVHSTQYSNWVCLWPALCGSVLNTVPETFPWLRNNYRMPPIQG